MFRYMYSSFCFSKAGARLPPRFLPAPKRAGMVPKFPETHKHDCWGDYTLQDTQNLAKRRKMLVPNLVRKNPYTESSNFGGFSHQKQGSGCRILIKKYFLCCSDAGKATEHTSGHIQSPRTLHHFQSLILVGFGGIWWILENLDTNDKISREISICAG